MVIAALILAVLALLYTRSVSARCNDLEDRLGELRRSVMGREAEVEELQQTMTFLHKVAERMSQGADLDPLMVREKRLFGTVTVADLAGEFDGADVPYVIDVRSDQEWAGGHLPGAVHMPLDSFEKNLHAVRRDGCRIHLICAMGSRSEAAASLLAERGYLNVFNVVGGMNGWRGEVVQD